MVGGFGHDAPMVKPLWSSSDMQLYTHMRLIHHQFVAVAEWQLWHVDIDRSVFGKDYWYDWGKTPPQTHKTRCM